MQERAERFKAAEGKRIGTVSEQAVCRCLQTACRTALLMLTTTLEHDLAELVRTLRADL